MGPGGRKQPREWCGTSLRQLLQQVRRGRWCYGESLPRAGISRREAAARRLLGRWLPGTAGAGGFPPLPRCRGQRGVCVAQPCPGTRPVGTGGRWATCQSSRRRAALRVRSAPVRQCRASPLCCAVGSLPPPRDAGLWGCGSKCRWFAGAASPGAGLPYGAGAGCRRGLSAAAPEVPVVRPSRGAARAPAFGEETLEGFFSEIVLIKRHLMVLSVTSYLPGSLSP